MSSYWRSRSRDACNAVREDWHALPIDERTEAQLTVMLRDAYPFGERANYPYEAWLIEQRFALAAEGYPSRRQMAVRAAQVAKTGQLSLLDGSSAVAMAEPLNPPQDGWDAAFEDLRNWKRQAWTEGDEDGTDG